MLSNWCFLGGFWYLNSIDFIILMEIKYTNTFEDLAQKYCTLKSHPAERNELKRFAWFNSQLLLHWVFVPAEAFNEPKIYNAKRKHKGKMKGGGGKSYMLKINNPKKTRHQKPQANKEGNKQNPQKTKQKNSNTENHYRDWLKVWLLSQASFPPSGSTGSTQASGWTTPPQ